MIKKMLPTEILMQEHRVIEQVLNCLEVLAQQGEARGELDVKSAKEAIDFFQNFADRCHHGKEEDCLFPALEQKGFSPEQGPTGVMRHEHEQGRQQIRGMIAASNSVAAGDKSAIADFSAHALAFVQHLREHIQKEDHCLFQMANQALNEQEQAEVMASFVRVEHDDLGPGTHDKYLDVASQLARRFGVEDHVSLASKRGSCCGHS